MKRIVSIVLPEGYADAEDFGKDCNVEIWHSHTLRYMFNALNQVRRELLDNRPVQAFVWLEKLEKEMEAKISESTDESKA